jgi:RNA polymerase sigma-70 factor (ECF subfamily)
MLRVRDGDDEAFAELVAAYQDRLIGIFYNMMRDRPLAEDLAQDVFLRIYRARERYEPKARFSTWVFRIANNVASNSRRKLSRKKEVPVTLKDSGGMPIRAEERLAIEKSALMPVRQLHKAELQDVVRSAMETLNERQRMALLLNKFEGMSYAEIGEVMELKAVAVKSLLSRARENLRDALEKYVR